MELKLPVLVLALSATMTAPVLADQQDSVVSQSFGAADVQQLFVQDAEPLQLAALSRQEMKETEGAFLPLLLGGATGFAFYAVSNTFNDQPITWQGSLYSIGTGALTGGVGGALIGASGGGLAANLAWRPNMIAANFGFSQYRGYNGW